MRAGRRTREVGRYDCLMLGCLVEIETLVRKAGNFVGEGEGPFMKIVGTR